MLEELHKKNDKLVMKQPLVEEENKCLLQVNEELKK
jgi:hypothetical protein